MIPKILELIGWSIVAGLFMYFGGEGHKQIKRIGVSLITLIGVWRLGMDMQWYYWLLCFGLMYGAMTTYLSTLFGEHDTVDDWEWVLTGILYGIVLFPYAIASGHWFGWGIRTAILSFLIWFVSVKFGNVFCEAFGRGAIIILTLPILLV